MYIDKEIADAYKRTGFVNRTVEMTGYSWNRVVKSLSSSGIIINDTNRRILDLRESGMDTAEIAKQLGLNHKTVESYIPRTRPVYGENRSKNAENIRRWRLEKKKEK